MLLFSPVFTAFSRHGRFQLPAKHNALLELSPCLVGSWKNTRVCLHSAGEVSQPFVMSQRADFQFDLGLRTRLGSCDFSHHMRPLKHWLLTVKKKKIQNKFDQRSTTADD